MIIAVANQKGGQGKTTTAHALATGSTGKTLAIDLDPQTNLTLTMDGNPAAKGVYELITGEAKAADTIWDSDQGDIIVANNRLTEISNDFPVDSLKNSIKPIKKKYDHIIIDCPPTLNVLMLNALVAADIVVIPLTADIYSFQGIQHLKRTIDAAKQINRRLSVGGVLFVKHNTRTILGRDLTEAITRSCAELDIPVYKTTIREGVAIREAQMLRRSIFEYAPKSKPAQDYKKLIEEIGL